MTGKRRFEDWMCFFALAALAFFAPNSTSAQGSAGVPECRADQLLGYYQDAGLSMAHDYANVVVRNRSVSACQLKGLPRIRQFDQHGKELQGGITGGCAEHSAGEPCTKLTLGPLQQAAFAIGMLDGTGLDNPVCANKLVLDSPRGSTHTWPALVLIGFTSCGRVGPQDLVYKTTPGVKIDPYTDMQASFPHGVPSGDWLLNLIDANAGHGQPHGPYAQGYDPPFTLILQNPDDSLLQPAVGTWCDGGVTINLRGPTGKAVPQTELPCDVPQSNEKINIRRANALALTLYLYGLGYDLSQPGEYKLNVKWRLGTSAAPILLQSNEITFTVAR